MISARMKAILPLVFAAVSVPRYVNADLLVSSRGGNQLLEYNSSTGAFERVFASSATGLSGPNFPTLGADGNLYIPGNSEVQRYNALSGAFVDNFVPPGAGGLNQPYGTVFGPDGNLYVANDRGSGFSDVLRFNGSTGQFMGAFAQPFTGLTNPRGIAFGPDGNLYVVDSTPSQVLRYNGATGDFMDTFIASHSGGLDGANQLLFHDGDLYVSSTNNDEVLRYDGTTGAFEGAFISPGNGLDGPVDMTFGPDGNFYLTSVNNNEVLRYNGVTGQFMDVFVSSGSGGLLSPYGLTFTDQLSSAAPEPSTLVMSSIVAATFAIARTRRQLKRRRTTNS